MEKEQLLAALMAFKDGEINEQQIVDHACISIKENVNANKVQKEVVRDLRGLLIKQTLSENGLLLWRQLENPDISIPGRFFLGL
ncbi:hypothetical protein KIJ11_06875 [Leuconostoc gelidum subsp. gelidum]|uniref:Bacteriocin immunity protein n=1 Tax=Leuconostoc gelidum subsp. gelidum TaxID=1607839 RepID=A0AB35FYR4_LEUGE|nr:hypothetical protein [Leuconostoc gelidum]MBZ5965012.1 hypothetical protein [Leuconostoc gelidum subsp. gelidum]MBZ5974423.1 hypothetical protein [Leuconostoc gelidum subsp. gelidum]MBZ5977262.1 hypothetical protein [Leuconostoc gelidum subsp. gelidum]MBZ5986290.1 hypothetical protein [Leuconostoc gelidum subsp. gelidum]MBZ5998914.1 hypothetical protein [Leuconostoc gelidum subsp. gelidum]